ncbi:hypothetical protein FNF31_06569 [Cafeteria roenbergensis]|uniref:Protein kinase domain-containing protein n=1 Tax=Cafeteria roenbergensis TaxID=33653 RepID=A0A5A8CIL9_CAFRO|nr:hypothetical protein FNF31_06569 [Cafeteria roenbergensis]
MRPARSRSRPSSAKYGATTAAPAAPGSGPRAAALFGNTSGNAAPYGASAYGQRVFGATAAPAPYRAGHGPSLSRRAGSRTSADTVGGSDSTGGRHSLQQGSSGQPKGLQADHRFGNQAAPRGAAAGAAAAANGSSSRARGVSHRSATSSTTTNPTQGKTHGGGIAGGDSAGGGGGGGGSGSGPHGDASEDDKDAVRRAQREKEWAQRQRLRDFVSSPEFDGNATTDFYGFGKVLGQGSFGKVRLAWHRLAGAKVAIKSYEKSRIKDAAQWKRVQQEIKLMERLNHPYVVRLLETIENAKRIHIVMEYAGGGNLCSYVKARRRLPEAEARKIFLQLLLSVEYMHGLGIIHRDIKLENVLFDSSRDMKLVDFGFSVACRDPNKRLKVFCGTPSYMAPEIVQRKEYLGRPVDIWSLGVLLYACLCGCFPFVAKTYPELYKRIAAAQLRFPDHVSNAAKDLVRRMLHPDPLKRIPLARARRHPWAAPLASAVLRQVAMPLDRSLLISDDPANDLYEAALAKAQELGFPRHRVVESVLSRSRTSYSTTYYLVLYSEPRHRC